MAPPPNCPENPVANLRRCWAILISTSLVFVSFLAGCDSNDSSAAAEGIPDEVANLVVPKDLCLAAKGTDFELKVREGVPDAERDYYRGWQLNKMVGKYDGEMTVAGAIAEAKREGWSFTLEDAADRTRTAKKIREITGMSMLEYAGLSPNCKDAGVEAAKTSLAPAESSKPDSDQIEKDLMGYENSAVWNFDNPTDIRAFDITETKEESSRKVVYTVEMMLQTDAMVKEGRRRKARAEITYSKSGESWKRTSIENWTVEKSADIPTEVANLVIPKDLCLTKKGSDFEKKVREGVPDAERDYYRGWQLNKLVGKYDGGMTVMDAIAEARREKWSFMLEDAADRTRTAKRIREITGMSVTEYTSLTPSCDEAGDKPAE